MPRSFTVYTAQSIYIVYIYVYVYSTISYSAAAGACSPKRRQLKYRICVIGGLAGAESGIVAGGSTYRGRLVLTLTEILCSECHNPSCYQTALGRPPRVEAVLVEGPKELQEMPKTPKGPS